MEKLKEPRSLFFISCLLLTGFMQIVIGMPVPLHYVFMILSMGIVVMSLGEDDYSLNWACVAFLAAAVISMLGNKIPSFFKPYERFALFVMLMIGCSPLFDGPVINKIKRHLTYGCMYALLAIVILSFLGYFLGFGKRLTGIVDSYMGVAGHPNFLGFYTMVAMCWVAGMFFRCTKRFERYVIIGLWIVCLITLLLSSSRSALACGLLGTLVAIYLRYQKNATAMMNTVMIIVAAIIAALPYLMPYTEAMMKKNMDFDDTSSMVADTRGYIWELRYMEIKESPIIGVGAYSCDINLPSADVFYVANTGTIELGSSYLGLLSQCGWLGFIMFLLIALPIVWKTFRYAIRERTPYAQMWLPIILVCAINMLFEGYLMTAGAVQCVVVWMVLGAAAQCDRIADYPVFWENEEPINPQQYTYWRDNIAEDGEKR